MGPARLPAPRPRVLPGPHVLRADRRRRCSSATASSSTSASSASNRARRAARALFCGPTHAILASSRNARLAHAARTLHGRARAPASPARRPRRARRARAGRRVRPARDRVCLLDRAAPGNPRLVRRANRARRRAQPHRRGVDAHLHRSARNRAGRTRRALLPPRPRRVAHAESRQVRRRRYLRRLATGCGRGCAARSSSPEHPRRSRDDHLDRRRELPARRHPSRALPAQSPRFIAPLPQPAPVAAAAPCSFPRATKKPNIAAALRSDSAKATASNSKSSSSTTARPTAPPRSSANSPNRSPRAPRNRRSRCRAGWCGKNFACHQLAALARHPLLVFMDADVRISRPDSLARLATFVEQSGAALVSGVPREETRGLHGEAHHPADPLRPARFSPAAANAAGPPTRASPPRAARSSPSAATPTNAPAATLQSPIACTTPSRSRATSARTASATDLFDATDTFHCRMYQRAAGGLARLREERARRPRLAAAHRPIHAAPARRPGPPVLAARVRRIAARAHLRIIGTAAAFLPRLIAVVRFRQSLLGALLHPLGICALVAIQWFAFFRSLRHRPAVWKGRAYSPAHAP